MLGAFRVVEQQLKDQQMYSLALSKKLDLQQLQTGELQNNFKAHDGSLNQRLNLIVH